MSDQPRCNQTCRTIRNAEVCAFDDSVYVDGLDDGLTNSWVLKRRIFRVQTKPKISGGWPDLEPRPFRQIRLKIRY